MEFNIYCKIIVPSEKSLKGFCYQALNQFCLHWTLSDSVYFVPCTKRVQENTTAVVVAKTATSSKHIKEENSIQFTIDRSEQEEDEQKLVSKTTPPHTPPPQSPVSSNFITPDLAANKDPPKLLLTPLPSSSSNFITPDFAANKDPPKKKQKSTT